MAPSSRFELGVRNADALLANLRGSDADIRAAVQAVVQENGRLCRELTQFFAPVDTGFMRDHVHLAFSPNGYVFDVGWDAGDFFNAGLAFYPFYQEYGTKNEDGSTRMAAQPSLGPAFAEVESHHKDDVARAIRTTLERRARGRALRTTRQAASRVTRRGR